MIAVAPQVLEEFRGRIRERLGLQFDESRLVELVAVLTDRMAAVRCDDFADYLERLAAGTGDSRNEYRALAERLTVGETYFFRNPAQFQALAESVVPRLLDASRPRDEIRLLSAGCASGEEPYTLVMLLRQIQADRPGLKFAVQAVDLNPAALEKAREALYASWSMRQMPEGMLDRCFEREAGRFRLSSKLRSAVAFEELNLVGPEELFWSAARFDVIFCRNVLMYLSADATRILVERLTRALLPGGYLFLGHAETLRGITCAFRLVHSHETFYYRRLADGEPRDESIAYHDPAAREPAAAPPAPSPQSGWFEAIAEAHLRIAELAGPSSHARAAADLPPEAERDPEALLLRAAVLVNRGDLSLARETLLSLAAVDEMNSGAQYLSGVCFEQEGELDQAVERYRKALYLDPRFAMPCLRLGRIAHFRGDDAGAKRALRQARDLLGTEHEVRILLFGGGFHRGALVALCEAELRALGAEA